MVYFNVREGKRAVFVRREGWTFCGGGLKAGEGALQSRPYIDRRTPTKRHGKISMRPRTCMPGFRCHVHMYREATILRRGTDAINA